MSATGYDLGDEVLFYFERVPSSEEGRIFYAEIPSSWFEECHYAIQVPSIFTTGSFVANICDLGCQKFCSRVLF